MKTYPGFSFFYKKEEHFIRADGTIETDELDQAGVAWHWNDGEDGPACCGKEGLPTISLGSPESKMATSIFDEDAGEYKDISNFVNEAMGSGFAIAFNGDVEQKINGSDIYYALAVTASHVIPLPWVEKSCGKSFPENLSYAEFSEWGKLSFPRLKGVAYAYGPGNNRSRAVKYAREFLS